jgi:starch synthase
LVPLYIKKIFKDNPLFSEAKLIYSVYNDRFDNELDAKFKKKLIFDGLEEADLKTIEKPDFINLTKLAIDNSDGLIFGSENVDKEIEDYTNKSGKPFLAYKNSDEYIDAYSEFYDKILP